VRDGFAKMGRAESEWADAAIETCRALAEARRKFEAHQEFGEWCDINGFGHDVMNHSNRAAAIKMGEHIEQAEPILRTTERRSLKYICSEECRFIYVDKTNVPETSSQSRANTTKPPARNVKLTRDLEEKIAAKLKTGMTQHDVARAITEHLPEGESISVGPVKVVAGAMRLAATGPGELSSTAAQKYDRALRRARIEIRAEVEAELRAEKRRWFDEIYLPDINAKLTRAERIIAGHKGMIPRSDYRKILACLHPDIAPEGHKDRFADAFNSFRELESVLVKADEKPFTSTLPTSLADLLARRKRPRA
jgi:hypothetical protein